MNGDDEFEPSIIRRSVMCTECGKDTSNEWFLIDEKPLCWQCHKNIHEKK